MDIKAFYLNEAQAIEESLFLPAYESILRVCRSAKRSFEKCGFPTIGSEDYKRSNIEKELHSCLPVAKGDFKLVSSENTLYEMPQEIYQLTERGKGVFVGSLQRFAMEYPSVIEAKLGTLLDVSNDALEAFLSMLSSNGLVIYCSRFHQESEPLSFELISNTNVLNVRRLLIILEEGASLRLSFTDRQKESVHSTLLTEIFAEKNSHLTFCDIENSPKSKRISSTRILQKENSHVKYLNLTLNNGFSRNNFYVELLEKNSEINLLGTALLKGEQHADNYTLIKHIAPYCHSNELFKYVVDNDARGVFSGRIYVDKQAQKTEAYQNCRNLLSSPQAKMHAKPQLEIYADDVKCSHGMTMGLLDEDVLFYMQQRGIPQEEARKMLSIAFIEEVIHHISYEPLRERLISVTQERFNE